MNQPRNLALAALFASLTLVAIGCGDDDAGPAPVVTDDYQNLDFDQPYGGLTMTDEAPAFADPELIAADAQDEGEGFLDPLADDPQVREMDRLHHGERSTFLRVVWGMLDGEGPDGTALDWTGSLRVDRGVLVVRRVVLFEPRTDAVDRPRPDRQTVAWHSFTGNHYDGLLVQVIERPEDREGERPNQLHFTTGPLTTSLDVAALPGLDQVTPVRPAGNAVHFVGFQVSEPDSCPEGFLAGQWHDAPDSAAAGGIFQGRWIGRYGAVQGHLRGRYGVNDAGERVFFGKYIGRDGRFRGLLAGTWQPGDQEGMGSFTGHWVNRQETVEGVLAGRYATAPERPGGFFQGRWATRCD